MAGTRVCTNLAWFDLEGNRGRYNIIHLSGTPLATGLPAVGLGGQWDTRQAAECPALSPTPAPHALTIPSTPTRFLRGRDKGLSASRFRSLLLGSRLQLDTPAQSPWGEWGRDGEACPAARLLLPSAVAQQTHSRPRSVRHLHIARGRVVTFARPPIRPDCVRGRRLVSRAAALAPRLPRQRRDPSA